MSKVEVAPEAAEVAVGLGLLLVNGASVTVLVVPCEARTTIDVPI
jgi:hypothetical protein